MAITGQLSGGNARRAAPAGTVGHIIKGGGKLGERAREAFESVDFGDGE